MPHTSIEFKSIEFKSIELKSIEFKSNPPLPPEVNQGWFSKKKKYLKYKN